MPVHLTTQLTDGARVVVSMDGDDNATPEKLRDLADLLDRVADLDYESLPSARWDFKPVLWAILAAWVLAALFYFTTAETIAKQGKCGNPFHIEVCQ